ncbi:MAG TPA: exonuclease SbcCD subunit D [Drouetiella sp.]
MPIQLIHVSDIHFGSGESHGRVNPQTGLNVRFEDFVKALSKTVDYAIEKKIDVFLFSGDAYRNASPEPVYQKMFAAQLKRLSDAAIQTVLVVGNHDQILRSTASHSMSVFQSLEVPGVITIDKPVCMTIDTTGGALQLIGLPHITRHQMMTLEKYANLPAATLDRLLVEKITDLLRGYYESLDPTIPTVVTAHMSLDRALAGIEQELLVGYTLTFPVEMYVDPRVDYVALGHIHRHQVIRESNPTITYAGSLERVDFGEEKEDKGFIHATIERKHVEWKFHSIDPRPFVTVEADLTNSENPTAKLKEKIEKAVSPGCVLRVRYKINQEQLDQIDENVLQAVAKPALTFKMYPEIVVSTNRARLPQLTESAVSSPIGALETYLDEFAPDRKEQLVDRARQLMEEIDSDLHCSHN